MSNFYKKIVEKLKTYQLRYFNFRLLIWLGAINILGVNVIASATTSTTFEKKQILGLAVGSVVMIVIALIDYNFILKFYWLIYLGNLLLLLLVKLVGANHMGAQRWIEFKGIQIQPSEFAKIFMILFFARFLMKYKDKINTFKIIALSVILFAIPLVLIYKQPDLSTSIVIIFIFCVIMYIAGISYKIIAGVFAAAIPAALILLYLLLQPNQTILDTYQYNRLIGFYEADNEIAERINYQQDNSLMAIGSGGLWGKGLNNDSADSVKNGNYILEPQTDFIFTIVGEELGFVGTVTVIILIALITYECFYTAAHAPDLTGRLICCGIGGLIAFQAFVNMGVATRLLPNTGLPLPFVSYGLSSLLSLMIGMGFVFNVGLHHKKLI
ncbi:MAG: FtsW/RodA/SpoVE family cell cycle protein [Lachnospiraceae bacterium]|nr:FtsW/RodA/SpoVE family cell cycle protein [Lachnospiraceae bacterium]MDE6698990.1 FtsW/RodA/SpoVE family cell cycle protein [Lachnospiraceae bacterium]